MKVIWNCNRIRTKISEFLATKEMTQTEFLRIIGCNSNSYGRFMKLKGPTSGSENGVYWGAHRFFFKRDQQKKAEAKKLSAADKKRKAQENSADQSLKKSKIVDLLKAVADITLEAGPDGSVPVFDDCDDVRKKSLEFMAANGMSKAEWLRLIGDIASKSWRDFVAFKGAGKGAANSSYPSAYYFLEKVRIVKGEKKSSKRIKAEAEHPQGYPLRHDNGMRWVFMGP